MALLLAAMAMATAARAQAPSIDASFAAFWSAADGLPFEQQEQVWDRQIEAPRRDLYDSVVWETQHDPDWRARRQRWLQARFAQYPALAAGIPAETQALRQAIAVQSLRFRKLFPDADAQPPVAILLAPNFDAKSGVRGDGTPVLAFATDSLLLEHANLAVVVPHELFHLYHAQHAGIRNDGVMPGAQLALPLFAEGMATYVSGVLSPGHADSELLLQDDLGTIAQRRLPDIARRFLADAHAPAIDPQHPETFTRWFQGNSRPYQPDLPNRSGYWLGLQLVRQLRQRCTLAQMAAWSPAQAQRYALQGLRQLADVQSERTATTGGTPAARMAGPTTASCPSSHSAMAPAGR